MTWTRRSPARWSRFGLLPFTFGVFALVTCLPIPEDQLGPPVQAGPRFVMTPSWTSVLPGSGIQLKAGFVTTSADTIPPDSVVWLSSDTNVAQVDARGLVRAGAIGVASVSALAYDTLARATVVVTPPVLVGAGDIASCASTGDEATADLLDSIPGVVFAVGDIAYEKGTTDEFANCYHPSWGRHRARTRPAPGNHEYYTPGAAGYFEYFGANAGDPAKGYYSFDLGSWHIVAINSNLLIAPSAQEAWLRADLTRSNHLCTLAFWHHPRFSSGWHGNDAGLQPIWQILYNFGADVVVVGHDHLYERFSPQTPDGRRDTVRGIRQFTIGTGGRSLTTPGTPAPNSELVSKRTYGVLKLELGSTNYRWEFVPVAGAAFTDAGTGACH